MIGLWARRRAMSSLLLLVFLCFGVNLSIQSSDAYEMICSDACVRLIPLTNNTTKEDLDKFDTASSNGIQCSQKSRELVTSGDSAGSVLKKLREIPLESIFPKQKNETKHVNALGKVLKELIAAIKRLEKVAEKIENCPHSKQILPPKLQIKPVVAVGKPKETSAPAIQKKDTSTPSTVIPTTGDSKSESDIVTSVVDPRISLNSLENQGLTILQAQPMALPQILPVV